MPRYRMAKSSQAASKSGSPRRTQRMARIQREEVTKETILPPIGLEEKHARGVRTLQRLTNRSRRGSKRA